VQADFSESKDGAGITVRTKDGQLAKGEEKKDEERAGCYAIRKARKQQWIAQVSLASHAIALLALTSRRR
jgi:hypothetical protein